MYTVLLRIHNNFLELNPLRIGSIEEASNGTWDILGGSNQKTWYFFRNLTSNKVRTVSANKTNPDDRFCVFSYLLIGILGWFFANAWWLCSFHLGDNDIILIILVYGSVKWLHYGYISRSNPSIRTYRTLAIQNRVCGTDPDSRFSVHNLSVPPKTSNKILVLAFLLRA